MASSGSEGRRKRIAKPQEERRKDLLEAAGAIFARDGVADAKIEDITRLAGVSKGTFYLYFKSKEAAAAETWRRYIDRFIGIGESILSDPSRPVTERLVSVFETLSEFVLSNASLHRNLYTAGEAEVVKAAANERLIAVISERVREGIDAGDIDCAAPEFTVRSMFHGVCGSINDAVRSRNALEEALLVRTAGHLARTVFSRSVVPMPAARKASAAPVTRAPRKQR